MSLDFHAFAIPRQVYDKHRGTRLLDRLFDLTSVGLADGTCSYAELMPELRELVDDEDDAEACMREFEMLISAGEVPLDTLSIGREWNLLAKLFEDAPNVFGKCFGDGEEAGGDAQFDAIYGDDVKILAEGLSALELGDDLELQLGGPIEWLRALYENAAANDWVVLRTIT